MQDRETARVAARNNAEWCDIVCRTHGTMGEFHADMWASVQRTPQYYPDAVTLDDHVRPERILSKVDTGTPGCSVKDSFASLDLFSAGFRVLFDAEWIYRSADVALPTHGDGMQWERIRDPALLSRWEAAWAGEEVPTGLFRPSLLEHEAVIVLGAWTGDRVVAGAILNRSESVVGVSNVFTTAGDLHHAWTDCLAAAVAYAPGVPVIGYQQGTALDVVHDLGFASVGPLRIWLADGAE